MNRFLFIITAILLIGCSEPSKNETDKGNDKPKSQKEQLKDSLEQMDIKSDYDLTKVDPKDRREFMEQLAQIERDNGEQWDFCKCTVLNDSLNKSAQKPNLSDSEMDKIMDRFDVIEKHCQAYIAQDHSTTPEERARHAKKVKDCLKEAGVN